MESSESLIEWGKTVLEGWSNINSNHPVLQFVKAYRYKHCSGCPKNVFNLCKACGCPLRAKLGSYNASCPLGYWNKLKVVSTPISDVMTKFEVFDKDVLVYQTTVNN